MPESVWDYPRPPRWERCEKRVVVVFAGETLADTTAAIRILETSHPPTFYLPPDDVNAAMLRPAPGRSLCEWKGVASYLDVVAHADTPEERVAPKAAWTYREPVPAFTELKDHIAVYPSRMDECTVDGERVQAQEGDFYGGWITSEIVGPFKGGPGTWGW
ncbi:MAG: DUF427 domain-containing protein [Planctomycetota bacterium]